MKVMKILRTGVAGVLIASVPVSASVAATRPNAAVPISTSTAVAAQADDPYRAGPGIAWPVIAVIAFAALIAVWIAVDDDDDGEGALTRG